ncbi:MAG: hypothetical protein WBZ36_19900 [Candidatus Nitrosopolaris sp.]
MIQTKTIALSPVAKPTIFFLMAAIVAIITAASIVHMPSAAGHGGGGHWHTASGTIASIQNENGHTFYIVP